MSINNLDETKEFEMRRALASTGTTLVGAALGARLANALAGGSGLPAVLAQSGGAILGAIAGKTLADEVSRREALRLKFQNQRGKSKTMGET